MFSSLTPVFLSCASFTSTYCNYYITGNVTQLDGKKRQKSIYSKEVKIDYINYMTKDDDENEKLLVF